MIIGMIIAGAAFMYLLIYSLCVVAARADGRDV